jgi:hypothetical protein
MKIHEFQAKKLLAEYGVPVPQGRIVATSEAITGGFGRTPARLGESLPLRQDLQRRQSCLTARWTIVPVAP